MCSLHINSLAEDHKLLRLYLHTFTGKVRILATLKGQVEMQRGKKYDTNMHISYIPV